MSRGKKKHVCSCGEEFNHGIGLRKHQRQTGHKGSSIVDDGGPGGDDDGDEEAAAPPPAAAPSPPPPPPPPPAPTPPPAPAPAPVAKPAPPPPQAPAPVARPAPPPVAAYDDEDDEPDQTVAVSRTQIGRREPAGEAGWDYGEGPSRYQHNKQKLTLVSSGLKVIAKSHARTAGNQIKQSARSGADIFTEAAKIAVALLLFMAIPAAGLWWWWQHNKAPAAPVNVPSTFTFDQGPLAARSALLQYLDALAKGRTEEAYSRLSGDWQQQLTASAFRESMSGIENIRWAVEDQKLAGDGSAEVTLVIAFNEDGRARKFQGRFRMTPEGQAWKVDRAELSPAPSS